MFKNSIILVLFVLIFVSCEKESDSIINEHISLSTEIRTEQNAELKSSTENGVIQGKLLKSDFPYIVRGSQISSNDSKTRTPGVWVDYTAKGTLRKIKTNKKMVLMNVQGIASGVYFCDVYSYSTELSIPSNSVAKVNIPSPCGYSNFDTQEIGVNFTQSVTTNGSSISLNTYTIVIRYNSIGQSIGLVRPCDGNTVTFSYSLMTY